MNVSRKKFSFLYLLQIVPTNADKWPQKKKGKKWCKVLIHLPGLLLYLN